jgi:uncharacterized membrane protein
MHWIQAAVLGFLLIDFGVVMYLANTLTLENYSKHTKWMLWLGMLLPVVSFLFFHFLEFKIS